MPTWLEIAKGPVFRFALIIMVLGLVRYFALMVWDMVVAMRRAGDRSKLPILQGLKDTLVWFLPTNLWRRAKPVFFYASFFFHLGILAGALLLRNHIDIIQSTVGITWPALSRSILDWVVFISIFAGAYIFAYRFYDRSARLISHLVDYLLLVLILSIIVSGYVARQAWNPIPYNALMLFHTLCGIVLMIVTPFTKVTHCVLFPLVRLGTEIGWRLAAHGGSDVTRTLHGSGGRKI